MSRYESAVRNVDRLVAIVRFAGSRSEPFGVQDVVRATGLSANIARRWIEALVLARLVERRYVAHSGRRPGWGHRYRARYALVRRRA